MEEPIQGPLGLLDLETKWFRFDGKTFNVASAPDEVFDMFIRQFVQVGWTPEDRRNALNAALMQPDEVEKPVLLDTPKEEEATEPPEPLLEDCPHCGGTHTAGTVEMCPLKPKKQYEPR